MASTTLPGFLTRSEAARLYNRSQRALERDLDTALRGGDSDALPHWKLVTKDGQKRDANEVSVELVKQLQADGKVPVWMVKAAYVEERFGKKGEPKPLKPDQGSEVQDSTEPAEGFRSPKNTQTTGGGAEPLPSDIAFLQERVRTLEREKREEADRNEKREAKLFDQLAVKDKQISAWDELTQGLTRALATGQLKPDLGTFLLDTPIRSENQQVSDSAVQDAEVQHEPTLADRPVSTASTRTSAKKQPSTKRNKGKDSKRKPTDRKNKQADKPQWYEMPTLGRFLSRK